MSDKVVSLDKWRKPQGSGGQQPDQPVLPFPQKGKGETRRMMDVVNTMFSSMVGEEDEGSAAARGVLCMQLEMRLEGLQPPQNPLKITEAKRLCEKYDDEELFGLIKNATDAQLSTKPHFFQGLLLVARERTLEAARKDKDASE